MVIYNDIAVSDLENIMYGLVIWEKHPLAFEHAQKYVKELRMECDTISKRSYHRDCKFKTHLKHGYKVYVYKRNAQTQWNLIYNWEEQNRIAFVNKILSNHITN